jgi:hypothetical protein
MRSRLNPSINAGQSLAALFTLPAAMLSCALGSFAQMTGGGCGRSSRDRKVTGSACLSTDIKWIANEAELRVASILVENNQAQAANIVLTPAPWTDSNGNQVSGGNLQIVPPGLTLTPGEAATVRIAVQVNPPLVPGMAYFTEIQLIGCPKLSISIGLVVNPQTRNDIYVSCSRCCGSRPRFLEICRSCDCPPLERGSQCGCDCDCCSKSACHDSCCHCEPCSPWPGCWDPHGHWTEDCELFYLPRPVPTINPSTGAIGQ